MPTRTALTPNEMPVTPLQPSLRRLTRTRFGCPQQTTSACDHCFLSHRDSCRRLQVAIASCDGIEALVAAMRAHVREYPCPCLAFRNSAARNSGSALERTEEQIESLPRSLDDVQLQQHACKAIAMLARKTDDAEVLLRRQ